MRKNHNSIKIKIIKNRSIANRLTISLFLLLIVVEGALLTVIYLNQTNLLRKELEKKADDYAFYLREILGVPIWDYDDEQINKIGDGFAKNDIVDELFILDLEEQLLYEYKNSRESQNQIKRIAEIKHVEKSIGTVKFSLSLDTFKSTIILLRNSMFIVLSSSLLIILTATGILLRYFIRNPIDSLQKDLDKVARGDYDYKFDDVYYKELSGIASRSKEMARLIQKREISLHEMNEELKQEISNRKKESAKKIILEKKLQQANKMEAIGTLAGGVAHDLNNMLSGIVAYPDLILMQIETNSPLVEPISAIKESGLKASAIVQDLLTLARRGVDIREVVNLNIIISQYLQSPEYDKLKSYHPEVTFSVDLDNDLLNNMGSPIHLTKTIMNLVSNAEESMPNGGEISVTTSNRYIDKPIGNYNDIVEGEYVTLDVSDNGVGISDKDQERIYEPFYTKKEMGRSGTGLGMAVVWGTVKDHGGYIEVESTVGKGTTFTLYFPATREKISEEKKHQSIEDLMGNGELILVVDDLKSQREIATNILTALGYVTTALSSGAEAIEFLKEQKADLIILDMIMDPGIDGLETYRRIIELYPDQKAIIASGFSETDRVKKAIEVGVGKYLKKPYTIEILGIAVKNELKK